MGTRALWLRMFSLLGPLHYPWVLMSVVFKRFANIRITDQIAFSCFSMRSCPERAYILAFPAPSSFPQRRKPGYAALLRILGNYFRPHLSIPRVCHRGATYQWKFFYNIKLVCERLRICTRRTRDRVIIRIACVDGRIVTRVGKFQFDLLPNFSLLGHSPAKKTAALPRQSRQLRRLLHGLHQIAVVI